MSRALVLAAAAAATAVVWQLRRRRQAHTTFTVLSWNILARSFTYWNRQPPKCVQGHHNPLDELEDVQQTRARYALASEEILTRLPDAVLLQECDVDFFAPTFNPQAEALAAAYEVVATNEDGPGTAVLLRKQGRTLVPTGIVQRVGASEERTGGYSKSATMVQVSVTTSVGADLLWLISIHAAPVKFNPTAVRAHLDELYDALRGPASLPAPLRVLLAGDLNASPSEVEELQRTSCLGGLQRVEASTLGHTGLSATFDAPCTIDHAFLSPGLRLVAARREKAPESPYAPVTGASGSAAKVVGASDHVWMEVQVALS